MIEAIRRRKISLNQIVNVVLLVVASLVAISIYQKQNKKFVRISQIRNEERKKNEVILRVGDLKKRTELYKETFNPVEHREIINTVMYLARATGTEVTSLKPEEKPASDAGMGGQIYNKVFYRLTVYADGYHELAKFINRLENNPILFVIESFQLRGISPAGVESTAGSEKLQAQLIISVLFLKNQ